MIFSNKTTFLFKTLYIYIIMCMAAAVTGCSGDDDISAPDALVLQSILADGSTPNPYDFHLDSAPDDGCVRFPVAQLGPLRVLFNDSNHVQLAAARAIGIDPISGDNDILKSQRPLVKVESCREYYVDKLTHSYPYLVPEAADLLHDIGAAFNDSLARRGGGDYRIKVTSVLRTPATVRRLRRVNRNATGESTHSYGTTFDISYSKFICDSVGSAPARTFEDLKNLLAEVIHDMRTAGRCYVKFEFRQSCFHITARPVL